MAKVVCLGEIMMRLSAEVGTRLNKAHQFDVFYGGGEANVAVSLANYGHQVQFASKIPDNSFGEAVTQHLRSYGVGTEYLLKGNGRLGSYYVEQGVSQRGTKVIYDRSTSAFAQMAAVEWVGPELFDGADIFHISGITPALSESWQQLTLELVQQAKKAGCNISFDSNYRKNLWTQKEAGAFLRKILPFVDYCSAGKLDAIHLLGIPETDASITYYYQKMQEMYPAIKAFYSTHRQVHSSSVNELQGTLFAGVACYTSKQHMIDPIVDRIGGGDAFTGGILHGLLKERSPEEIIEFATAASVLKHSVKGDCNQFSEKDVLTFAESESAKIER
ncbi:MAG: sugar kinase [Enterococcus gilvus]